MATHILPDVWMRALCRPWSVAQPNRGYLLRDSGRIVGLHPLIRSSRIVDGRPHSFANLTAWCVLPEYRMRSLSLLDPILKEAETVLTDFAARPEIARLLQRRGFRDLDRRHWVIPNVPATFGGTRVVAGWQKVEGLFDGAVGEIVRDHAGSTGVLPLAVSGQGRLSLILVRLHHRLRLPAASVLYSSDPGHLRDSLGALGAHLFWRHRAAITLIEQRLVPARPALARSWTDTRRLLYRSSLLPPDRIDYLYSEIMLLPIF
jgi:hypothetical protein